MTLLPTASTSLVALPASSFIAVVPSRTALVVTVRMTKLVALGASVTVVPTLLVRLPLMVLPAVALFAGRGVGGNERLADRAVERQRAVGPAGHVQRRTRATVMFVLLAMEAVPTRYSVPLLTMVLPV